MSYEFNPVVENILRARILPTYLLTGCLRCVRVRNVVHRSEYIDNHLNPYWKPASLSVEELCYGDLDCPLKVTVFDYQKDGKHRKIGEVETTLQGLMDRVAIRGNADRERGFRLFKEDQETVNRGLSEMKTRGLLIVLKAELQLESN